MDQSLRSEEVTSQPSIVILTYPSFRQIAIHIVEVGNLLPLPYCCQVFWNGWDLALFPVDIARLIIFELRVADGICNPPLITLYKINRAAF